MPALRAYPLTGDPSRRRQSNRTIHPLALLAGAAVIATTMGAVGLLASAHGPIILADIWLFASRLGNAIGL